MKRILLLFTFFIILKTGFAQYPIVDITNLQQVSLQDLVLGNDQSYYFGDTVQVEGIVTFDPCYYALSSGPNRLGTFLEKAGNGPWSGIEVLIGTSEIGYSGTLQQLNDAVKFLDNFKPGNKVRATGVVGGFSGNTQIYLLPIQSQILSLATPPAPKLLSVDTFSVNDGSGQQIQQKVTGELYEGVLVEFQNVFVVDIQPSGSRTFWSVQDNSGNKISIRDASGHFRNDLYDYHCTGWDPNNKVSFTPTPFSPPTLGSYLSYIRGIVVEYQVGGVSMYGIAPRTPADIGPVTAAPPVISTIKRSPIVAQSTDPVTVSARIIDPDGTIATAQLFYSIGLNNTNFQSVNMTNTSGDTWSGTIPAAGTDSVYVNYWIKARDNNNDTTAFPGYNSTSNFYLVLNNGINQIADIQATPKPSGASVWAGDSITSRMNINAVVTATNKTYDLGTVTIQDARAPYSGLFLMKTSGDNLETLKRGDSILITGGKVIEDFGVTHLTNVQFSKIGKGTVPAPITGINVDSIINPTVTAEMYEGMLVRFNAVAVIDTNPDVPSNFGEWSFSTDATDTIGLRADDRSLDINFGFNVDSLSEGMTLTYIQGILYYSFGNWKLLPRNKGDIAGFSTNYPRTLNTFEIPATANNPQIICNVDQNLLRIECSIPDTVNLNGLIPTIDYSGDTIVPGNQVAQNFSNPLTYTVFAPVTGATRAYSVNVTILPVGIKDKGTVKMNVYPNPASNVINISLASPINDVVEVQLFDLLGNRIKSQKVNLTAGSNQLKLSLDNVSNGIYFLDVKGEKVKVATKVNVAK